MTGRAKKIEGGLWGLLVGDALGGSYEFHPAREIPPFGEIEMFPPEGFPRSYAHIAPGTWSDDGAQTLCLMASLLECFQWSIDDFAQRLPTWSIYQVETTFLRELEDVILPAAGLPPGGTGYVVDSLHPARHACRRPPATPPAAILSLAKLRRLLRRSRGRFWIRLFLGACRF